VVITFLVHAVLWGRIKELTGDAKKTALAVGLTKAVKVRNHPSHHHEN
jgi:hypothetical protein